MQNLMDNLSGKKHNLTIQSGPSLKEPLPVLINPSCFATPYEFFQAPASEFK